MEHLVVRTLEAHEWQAYRDVRLRSLADSPDAFGSTLAAEMERTPDAWAARLAAAAVSDNDHPLVAELAGKVVGLVWAKVDPTNPSLVNLFQMWVAPECRGRGIAARLLCEAIQWARTRDARLVQLGVTCGDTSAVRLYVRAGFRAFGPPAPLRPGSVVLSQIMKLVFAENAG